MKINKQKITTHALNLSRYSKSDKIIKMKTLDNKR